MKTTLNRFLFEYSEKILCPSCKGKKWVNMFRHGSTKPIRHSCPACQGRGYKEVQLQEVQS